MRPNHICEHGCADIPEAWSRLPGEVAASQNKWFSRCTLQRMCLRCFY
jgi:hypothetical protein